MPPRRGVRRATSTRTAKRVSTKPSVSIIANDGQWKKVLKKSGGKFVLAQFGRATHKQCKMLKTCFYDCSKRAEFKHISFVDVDITKAPEAAKEVGAQGDALPVFAIYKNGELLEKLVGMSPQSVVQLIIRHADPAKIKAVEAAKSKKGHAVIGWVVRIGMLGGVVGAVLGGIHLLGRKDPNAEEQVGNDNPNFRVPWNTNPDDGFDDVGLDDFDLAFEEMEEGEYLI